MNAIPNKSHYRLRIVEGNIPVDNSTKSEALFPYTGKELHKEKEGDKQPQNQQDYFNKSTGELAREMNYSAILPAAPTSYNLEKTLVRPLRSRDAQSSNLTRQATDQDFMQWLFAKYRSLLEQLPAITYIASLEKPGKLLYLNPKIQELGFSHEAWLNNPDRFFDRIHEDDRPRVIAAYANTYTYRIPLYCEYRLFKDDGGLRWFRDEASIIRDNNGEMVFLQGVLTDITGSKESESELMYYRTRLEYLVSQRTGQLERQCAVLESANSNLVNALSEQRRVELALRNSEEHFRMMLESAGEGVLGLDVDGSCTFANQTALTMLGYSREEILGQDLYALIRMSSDDDLSAASAKWDVYDAYHNDMPLRNSETFKRSDGTPLRVEYSSYPMHLNDKLNGAVLIFRDVTESLCYQATHDPLTGLINRTEFWRRMNRVLVNAHENHSEHILCYLDLDQFKTINDRCGHAAGDQLLCKLSSLLQSKLRQRDSLARMGGDEFALLLEHCSLEQGCALAAELCEIVSGYRFTWEDECFPVGVSIGVTTVTRADQDIGTALRKADAACYMAKEQGRNRVEVFKAPPFKQYHFHS